MRWKGWREWPAHLRDLIALGLPAGFVAFGMLLSFASNLGFGLAGGFLGYLVLAALRKAGFFAYLSEKR